MDRFQLKYLSDTDIWQLGKDVRDEKRSRESAERRVRRLWLVGRRKHTNFDTLEALNESISAKNSSGFYSLPHHDNKDYSKLSAYLPALIGQDWSHIYSGGDAEQKYYVYAHVDPRLTVFLTASCAGGNYGGSPFYIGKGAGNRAYDLKRNQGHGKYLRDICADGYDHTSIVKIVASDLSEAKAFEIEAKLIHFFGTLYQKTKVKGCLVNLDVPDVPRFKSPMDIIRTVAEWNHDQKQKTDNLLLKVAA